MKKNKKSKEFELTEIVDLTPENNEVGINRFKTKDGIHSFKVRFASTIILLLFLLFFIVTGALYTSLINIFDTDIFSYLSIVSTILVLSFCLFEINMALNFSKWYLQMFFILVGIFIYIFPTSKDLYNFSFYQKMNLSSWFSSWQLPVIICIILFFYFLSSFINKSILKKDTLVNFMISMIIIFGLKGFSIASLSLNPFYEVTESISARFSFNTIIWIWLMIILSDSFAYIGGMTLGKTKLASVISPKKTWEGALIGLSVSTFFGIIYALIFIFTLDDYKPLNETMELIKTKSQAIQILIYILLAVAFPIIGLFGDLLFSWVKRSVKIKDFSKLIPGHGGLLDRLDSIVFSLFILFLFLTLANTV
ncbi:phosphatidate cytidylyltransferase [Spiroplasma taiwanense]|uniref:Phosphatidate cytidylyltransferase n=1 Tax=Spiroplasma taiwanense CT-1 TaxID=1276220 RepID=S5M0A6_9MOLU|nr:phosphatidate cytidylyltransferase [Spiroplasma taiwanense]AGR41427.1 phosphatidate cytidylyltransferase [Spiroplasma taiwanense CT-1]